VNLSIIPNIVSTIRIVLIYPIVELLRNNQFELALTVFIIACLTDLIDGDLARRYNWKSKIGSWLDPIADKLLLNSVYFYLWLKSAEMVPLWLLLCILSRDLLIIMGVIYYYFKVEKVSAKPTTISKLNTLMQFVLIFLILLHLSFLENNYSGIPDIILSGTMIIVLGLTLASGTWYGVIGLKRAFVIRKATL